MQRLALIMLAGGLGTGLRYLMYGWGERLGDGSFPLGTLIVNASGCLAIGLLGAYFGGPNVVPAEYRAAVLIGLLGGYTTFSTFAWETVALANDGQFRRAALNIILSNTLGLGGAWIGFRAGERLFGV